MSRFQSSSRTLTLTLILLLSAQLPRQAHAFVPQLLVPSSSGTASRTFPYLNAVDASNDGASPQTQTSTPAKKPRKQPYTLGQLSQDVVENPAKYVLDSGNKKRRRQGRSKKDKSAVSARRTRRKVDEPQQTYMYAAQRRALEQESKENKGRGAAAAPHAPDAATAEDASATEGIEASLSLADQARELGLIPSQQACEATLDDLPGRREPTVVGKLRVSDAQDSSAMAYLIDKPAGWAIVGRQGSKKSKEGKPRVKARVEPDTTDRRKDFHKKVRVADENGSVEEFEYNEYDIFDLMTEEEIHEFVEDGGELPLGWKQSQSASQSSAQGIPAHDAMNDETHNAVELETTASKKQLDPTKAANLRRIALRQQSQSQRASFRERTSRPSVMAWLKEHVAETEERTIRAGNFWTAVAGASGVDDSGLVLVCPKTQVDQVFVEYAAYVAVVGSGGCIAPASTESSAKELSQEEITSQVLSKLRTARDDDIVHTVRYVFPERKSSCDSVVPLCQDEFKDGIRGDPAANPFDRRAPRRLIHCQSMSVSSLAVDDALEADTTGLPDDMAIISDRRHSHKYTTGSFLGRASLGQNPLTNAYREINGAADGFPGWIVDRYDKWLLVQHDPMHPKGPLPSIHDGNTDGVYYLEAKPDRSSMGTVTSARPRLIEGKHAPDLIPVRENGVNYLVSLDRDLSTGIFLDQRPQRAWLAQNCNNNTHVLNCFAHTGAFSVAAATAGAMTVSLDLSKKWLDRLPLHLAANDIEFDELHDSIYGDCFEWLTRLANRGEKYDIVILDPPSSSVGRKKKRWSVKSDMDELVALAAVLVKKGGLLWTTTNSASMSPIKFARACKRGLDTAGIPNAKLERIQPMPVDFPVVGPQPVKNLVWRIP